MAGTRKVGTARMRGRLFGPAASDSSSVALPRWSRQSAGCMDSETCTYHEGRTRTPKFAPLAWHDNPVRGLRLETGDPDASNWHSYLVLDINHIFSWANGTEMPF